MVTDPNIILSGNQMAQPRLPDVNAMMQTRTAGMENIYALEQQRAAQAQMPDPARTSNKDGYTPDAARAGDKFDPYTQGANQSTSSALTDSKSTTKKSSKSHKKAPAAPTAATQ